MAPTRRRRTGGAALDAGAMERIDAITLEPLSADGKYVELMSPDRTLKLYYNTSTLIRIAQDAGGFMQPPHFREAMSEEMQKQVEELEKKTFHFEKGGRSLGESLGSIHHRHVYFEQIIDEFYHLSSADVYVCPVCYEHYLRTRYLPRHPRVAFVNNGETPVVDPLTLLQWSSPPEEEEEADDDVVESHATTMDTISRFVFRYATHWKKHMDVVHHLPQMSTQDYRLRDVLCSYYSAYNQRQTEKAKAAAAADDQKKLPLTQHRYWRVDAGYNRVRYNRLVEALEAIPDRDRNAVETAFPDETMNFQLNPVDEGDDDFVVEDDDVSSSSCDSGYHPRYQPPESLRATSSSSSSSTSSASSTPPAEVRPTGSRKRGRLSYSHSSSTSSSSASTPVTSKGGEDNTPSSSRRIQLRHGRLAPLDGFTARLSAEDQHFLASQTSKTYRPNSLYDPKMHQYFAKQAAPKNHEEEEVDWECIGEHTSPPVEPSTSASDDEDEEEEEESETATAVPFISRGGLLLDDDE